MAYTRVWDNTAPPGTAPANTIDTIFQQFRVDTQERITSILKLGTTIDDDPLQIRMDAITGGGLTDRQLTSQPFVSDLNTPPGAPYARFVGVPVVASQITGFFGRVPGGCTIKEWSVRANITLHSGTDVIFRLVYSVGFSSFVVSTLTFTASGPQVATSGPLALVVAAGGTMFVSIFRSASIAPVPDADVYNVTLTIDTATLEESF